MLENIPDIWDLPPQGNEPSDWMPASEYRWLVIVGIAVDSSPFAQPGAGRRRACPDRGHENLLL
jgi:hypothetical protein